MSPSLFLMFVWAPFSSSMVVTCVSPFQAAPWSAVSPILFCALTSTLSAASSRATHSMWPPRAAQCSGVDPACRAAHTPARAQKAPGTGHRASGNRRAAPAGVVPRERPSAARCTSVAAPQGAAAARVYLVQPVDRHPVGQALGEELHVAPLCSLVEGVLNRFRALGRHCTRAHGQRQASAAAARGNTGRGARAPWGLFARRRAPRRRSSARAAPHRSCPG